MDWKELLKKREDLIMRMYLLTPGIHLRELNEVYNKLRALDNKAIGLDPAKLPKERKDALDQLKNLGRKV